MEHEGKKRGFWKLLSDHNPFYLLSALCMLAGYFILTNAVAQKAGRIVDLGLLLGVLNVYEFLIIGLGIFLAVKKKVYRDSAILLVISILFLFDATFLNVEIFTASPVSGGVIHGFILILGLAKGAAIIYFCMKTFRSVKYLLYLGIEYGLFLLLPGLFAVLSRSSSLNEWGVYGAWWLLGIMIAVKGFLVRRPVKISGKGMERVESLISGGLIVIPAVSFLIHLSAANWIHSVPFYFGNIAPVILGGSVFIGTALRKNISVKTIRILHIVLPVTALFWSIGFPEALSTGGGYQSFFVLTPFRLILFAIGLVFGGGVFHYRKKGDAVLSGVSFGTGCIGASFKSVFLNVWKLFPKTSIQWGVMIVIAGFLLFVAGALISLRKTPEKENI